MLNFDSGMVLGVHKLLVTTNWTILIRKQYISHKSIMAGKVNTIIINIQKIPSYTEFQKEQDKLLLKHHMIGKISLSHNNAKSIIKAIE